MRTPCYWQPLFILKIILTTLNILIILYLPMLEFSGDNIAFLKGISYLVFTFFLIEIVRNVVVFNKAHLLINCFFVVCQILLPIALFLIAFCLPN